MESAARVSAHECFLKLLSVCDYVTESCRIHLFRFISCQKSIYAVHTSYGRRITSVVFFLREIKPSLFVFSFRIVSVTAFSFRIVSITAFSFLAFSGCKTKVDSKNK
uniref:Uncharacterized protein n=1 Tax=Cacopsylla melanoneura TaxID=428564 RepID=A0A8D8W3W6_9HEMI